MRILQIIRKGTPGIPAANPSPDAAETPHISQVQSIEDRTLSTSRVRILTQAEAEALATPSR